MSDKRRRLRLLELSLFLFVWSVYGVAINSANLNAFNLQQAGIEAMVERRQFSLEGSATPQFQIKVYYYDGGRPFGDTFMYNGRQYAAKQPGQFMAGAIVYFFLRLLGLSYLSNYTLTSALVSFFTSSLATAAAALAVFRIARLFTERRKPFMAFSERNSLRLRYDCFRLFRLRLPRHAGFRVSRECFLSDCVARLANK